MSLKHPTIHHLLAATLLTLASLALATSPPPGLESWGGEDYRLEPGESTSFTILFNDIPVRRWVLYVEGGDGVSHLNVRRVTDGSLLYDVRDERYHQVDVPWGTGEQLSGVITAGGRGGVYRVSIWGPPRGSFLQSYGYEVNRALEAMDRGDLALAEHHLRSAQHQDPDDEVATLLLAGLAQGVVPTGEVIGDLEELPEDRRQIEDALDLAQAARAEERYWDALEHLEVAHSLALSRTMRIELMIEFLGVYLDLDNLEQARQTLMVLERLGLDEERLDSLEDLVERQEVR